jgi:hypothetical protein
VHNQPTIGTVLPKIRSDSGLPPQKNKEAEWRKKINRRQEHHFIFCTQAGITFYLLSR